MIYKNISDQEHVVPNVGVWQPGEEKESPIEIINENFKLISGELPKEEVKVEEVEDKEESN